MSGRAKTAAVAGREKNLANYFAALEAVGVTAVATLDPAEALRCGGLLLPGGGDVDPARFGEEDRGSVYVDRDLDGAQLEILDGFVRAGRPVLGICRGHQVVNVYFGGGLVQHLPGAETHMAQGHRDRVHPVDNEPGSLLYRMYGGTATVNSAHHQGLAALGRGLRAVSCAPDGVVEGAEHEDLPILTVQFHPERMAFRLARPDTADGRAVFEWFADRI